MAGEDIDVGQTIDVGTLRSNKFKHYNVEISRGMYKKGQDLVFRVDSTQGEDYELYISKKNEDPDSTENSEWQCLKDTKDTCVISGKYINNIDLFYVGIRCREQCKLSLTVWYQNQEELLSNGEELQVDFDSFESKIFKVHIPTRSASRDEDLNVQSMTMMVAPLLAKDETYKVFVILNEEVKPIVAMPGWKKGKVARVSSHQDGWCTDCFIKLLVHSKEKSKYLIKSKASSQQEWIFLDKTIEDAAYTGDRVCYKFYVKNEKADLAVQFKMYSGLVSYSLNPEKMPFDHESSKFKNVAIGSSRLVISKREREEADCAGGLFYLCVFPHITSTYQLKVSEVLTNQAFKQIEDEFDEVDELQGKDMKIYFYKVPPLEYTDEDIFVKFSMTSLSGEAPLMAVSFCDQKDHTKCAKGLTYDDVFSSSSSKFTKAKRQGNDVFLSIDHDENKCQTQFNGECYYTIVLQGQNEKQEYSKYQLYAEHSQNNYKPLLEGQQLSDYVNLNEYKYYKFSLSEQVNIKSITFRLTSLHGDADLYVSRNHQKPEKLSYEKSSIKQNNIVDEVTFDDDNLDKTFYIGVYSMMFSTYRIEVKVEREFEPRMNHYPLLTEGVSVRGSIHNEQSSDTYKIDIKQAEGFEKEIKIQVTPLESKVKFFVHTEGVPSKDYYIWQSENYQIVIKPSDKNFKREATYYVTVYPEFTFWQQFIDNYYKYLITYVTTDNYIYLQNRVSLENRQSHNSYSYFRHFISQSKVDYSVSMTVFAGSPVLFASLSPSVKYPNKTHHDFTTRNQTSISGSKAKAFHFTQKQLKQLNPSCEDFDMLNQMEPCVIYASVFCADECKYSLKLQYDNSGLQQLIVGVPQHDILKDKSFNYYYVTVRENKTQVLYSTLSSLHGNADLYVSLVDNPASTAPENWARPTLKDYVKKSVNYEGQDIVKLLKDDLDDCYQRFDTSKYGQGRECVVIYGVYANKPVKQEDDQYSTRYNLVVYTDVIQIMSQTPMQGFVEQGSYQYYFYEVTCEKCSVIISLSTFGNGDPDLYINFGDQSLPTQNDFHIQSTTYRAELVIIDNNNWYLKSQGRASMKGHILLGVYGAKKSNYTLSITQEQSNMILLVDGQATKAVQDPYGALYYLWYNAHEEQDFKVYLNVKNGNADVVINTYDDTDEKQNLVEQLPKSKRKSRWVLSDVSPLSSISNRELLVTNTERGYCYNCFYIIGILTHDAKTDYSVAVEVLDANFTNSQLMKLGENYETTLWKNQTKIYRFIVDDVSPFQVVTTLNQGTANTTLSFNQDGTDPITLIVHADSFKVDTKSEKFATERMYYLIVNAHQEIDAEYSVMVVQEKTIIQLKDGAPQRLSYSDYNDVSKHLIYLLPEGDFTVQIQVKTKSKDFYPRLYVKYYSNIEGVNTNDLEFPPGGDPGFDIAKNWDYKLGVLNFNKQFKGNNVGSSALAINLFEASDARLLSQKADAILTITTSKILKMVHGTAYIGQLESYQSFMVYQVEEKALNLTNAYLVVEFTQCFGESEYSFIESPSNINIKAQVNSVVQYDKYGKQLQFIKLPLDKLYILVKAKTYEMAVFGEEQSLRTDYVLKTTVSTRPASKTVEYHLANNGDLRNEMLPSSKSKFNLTWSGLFMTTEGGDIKKVENPIYHIVATKEPRARLDSVCAIRKDIGEQYMISSFKTSNTYYIFNNPLYNEKYFINVFAEVGGSDSTELEMIPYKPLEVFIPYQSVLSKLAIVVYVLLIIGVGVVGYWMFKKTKKVEQSLEYEMTGIYPKSGGSSRYASLEGGER